MPLWIGSYLADTMHLSRDEHGGYLLLIMTYWRTREPLPDDDKHLSAIVKATPKEWKLLRPVLVKFFTCADGIWRHKRIEQELADATDKKLNAASKAKAGAEARWKHHIKNAPSIAPSINNNDAPSIIQALPKQCPTPSPIKPSINLSTNAGAQEKFAMRIGWQPSDHVAEQARQSLTPLEAPDLPEYVAHWLTQHGTTKTQAEWDKGLLQATKYRKMRGMSPHPAKSKPEPQNFAVKDYGSEIRPL